MLNLEKVSSSRPKSKGKGWKKRKQGSKVGKTGPVPTNGMKRKGKGKDKGKAVDKGNCYYCDILGH